MDFLDASYCNYKLEAMNPMAIIATTDTLNEHCEKIDFLDVL